MYEICLILFCILLLYGAICDLVTFEIPNFVSVLGVVLFILTSLGASWQFWNVALHLVAGGTVLSLGAALFLLNICGGGDVKILSAVAVWFGFSGLLPVLFWVALFGGILCLILMLYRTIPLPRRFSSIGWLRNLHKRTGIPYGVAIGSGSLVAFSQIHQVF